jgi:DNA-binding GntR family transcriptional regulator
VAGELAARAAKVIDDEECERLSEILDNLESAVERENHDEAEDFDYEFHRRINATGRAPKLVWLLNAMVPYARHAYTEGDRADLFSIDARRSVLQALCNRDPEEARRSMAQQILDSRETIAARFESAGLWSDRPLGDELDLDAQTADFDGGVDGRVEGSSRASAPAD